MSAEEKENMYKQFTFYGINQKRNILSGVIVFILVVICFFLLFILINTTSINFYRAIGIVILAGAAGVFIFLKLIAKRMSKKWQFFISNQDLKIYFNGAQVIKSPIRDFHKIKYINVKGYRYLTLYKRSGKIKIIKDKNLEFNYNDFEQVDKCWDFLRKKLEQNKYNKNDLSNSRAVIMEYTI